MTPRRGRFAPSPTSDLHVGNLRTALLAWLFARVDGLDFLVRIEDLDQDRVAAAGGVERRQLEDLAAIGVDWDEQPIHQSERREIYADAASRLETYPCFCSRKEIAEASSAPQGSQVARWRPYPGTCAHLSSAQRAERALTRRPAIRVRAGVAEFTVTDRHAGRFTGPVDDFVLFRGDGTPAYNLAAVVDDGLQGITQVTRGADLLDSAPRQAWLATSLGFAVPEYVHVGLGFTAGGERLAKRHGSTTLTQLRDDGLTAGEVVRALCRTADLPEADDAPGVLARVAGAAGLDRPGVWDEWTWPPAGFPDQLAGAT